MYVTFDNETESSCNFDPAGVLANNVKADYHKKLESYSSFAEDDVSVAGWVDVDVRTTDDEERVLLAFDGHLSHTTDLLQTYTKHRDTQLWT